MIIKLFVVFQGDVAVLIGFEGKLMTKINSVVS